MEPNDGRAEGAARAIWTAWRAGKPLAELPDDVRPRTFEEGWAAQEALDALVGDRYGWKLAATSEAGRRHVNVDRSLVGRLFARFRHEPGATLPAAHLTMGVVEAEFAFVLGRDVTGAGPHERETVLDAVDALHLALEVPDTRLERFTSVGAAQLVADDACAGMFVLGPAVAGWRSLDLAAQAVRVLVNGELAGEGSGANVLSDPREALTWLANELPTLGASLRAGDIVTTGTTTVPPAIRPGDAVLGDFGELGTVGVRFRP